MRNKTVASKLRAIARKLMQSFDGGQHTNGRVADRRLLRSAQWEIFTTLNLVNYYLKYHMEDGKVPSCT